MRRYSILDTRYFALAFYIVVTVFGCLFIVATKSMGLGPAVSTAVPIGFMILYFAISLYAGKLRVHDEQVGDNLYYMGFLFTLSSLGTSLYQFGTSASTDEIVRNFGIAVASTITGIALRIFYNQVRRDPADVERATRYELTDMTRRVRTELENVAKEFADFRRVCNQMIEEGFEEIVTQAEKNGESIRRTFEGISSGAIEPVRETSLRVAKHMEQSVLSFEGSFSKVSEAVSRLTTSLETSNTSMVQTISDFQSQAGAVQEKLSRLIIPDEVIKTEVIATLKMLDVSVGKFTARSEALLKEHAEGASEKTGQLRDAILELTKSQRQLVAQLENRAAQESLSSQVLMNLLEKAIVPMPTPVEEVTQDDPGGVSSDRSIPLQGVNEPPERQTGEIVATASTDAESATSPEKARWWR